VKDKDDSKVATVFCHFRHSDDSSPRHFIENETGLLCNPPTWYFRQDHSHKEDRHSKEQAAGEQVLPVSQLLHIGRAC